MSRRLGALTAALALALSLGCVVGCAGAGATNAIQQALAAPTADEGQPATSAELEGEDVPQASAPTDASAAGVDPQGASAAPLDLAQLPAYGGSPYVVLDDNLPALTDADVPAQGESYAPLDPLGRCGAAVAVVSPSTMPAEGEERGSIGMVRPTGWHTVRYDGLVDGSYLYNRCHLIGWQLTAENANERNLVTGTRYMNTEGMLPFEDEVAAYVERTGGRVLYRATPVFYGDELVCRGVRLEARSLDDGGLGVCFDVFCYNVQPGVGIDYATGDSWLAETQAPEAGARAEERTYVLNTNTRKFHYPECGSVDRMSEKNKQVVTDTRDDLLAQGYDPCGNCRP